MSREAVGHLGSSGYVKVIPHEHDFIPFVLADLNAIGTQQAYFAERMAGVRNGTRKVWDPAVRIAGTFYRGYECACGEQGYRV